MKAFLMHPDRDFNLQQDMPPNEPALMQDLELSTLFDAMAQGAPFYSKWQKGCIVGIARSDTIRYRQEISQMPEPSVGCEGTHRISVDWRAGDRAGMVFQPISLLGLYSAIIENVGQNSNA